MKTTLYIMCGLPFSGKTTLAKEIKRYLKNAQHVCIDDYYYEFTEKDNEQRWAYAFEKGYRLTHNYLQNSTSVIFDATNYLKKERLKLVKIAHMCNADYLIIFVDTEREIAKRRLIENRILKNRKNVANEDWQDIIENFQVPDSVEKSVSYDSGIEMRLWIKTNINKVHLGTVPNSS